MKKGSEITVIANPQSGWGRGRRFARILIGRLREKGYRVRALWTGGRGHAEALAREEAAGGNGMLLVCGGDGTLHETIQALAGTETMLAPAPAGRCNDFCRALGLASRVEEVLRLLERGQPSRVDLARVDGRHFCTVGALGFDAAVSRFVDEMTLPLRGTPAYLYAALTMLARYQCPEVELTWDGGHYQGPFFMCAVGNTPTYGNNIPVTPGADPRDGRFRVCLVRPVTLRRVLTLIPKLLKGGHAGAPEVDMFDCSRLVITTDRPVELWADGEPVAGSPLSVEILPRALSVIGPLP